PGWAHVVRAARQVQGPDYFRVWMKDGRILTYGRTPDSLVKGRNGVRHSWMLNRVEDRAGNTIVVQYTNEQVSLPAALENIVPTVVRPDRIAYTGHGDTVGSRE